MCVREKACVYVRCERNNSYKNKIQNENENKKFFRHFFVQHTFFCRTADCEKLSLFFAADVSPLYGEFHSYPFFGQNSALY